eukprot:19688-Heterococcus_DN1.PRE.2
MGAAKGYNQCPWDARAPCATAISAAGHLDLLRWLMDNGCPWEARDLCISAAVGGRIDVLVYLQQKGLLTSAAPLTNMLDYAGAKDRLAAMQWLREQGAEWPTAHRRHRWSGETLEWAIAAGFTPLLLENQNLTWGKLAAAAAAAVVGTVAVAVAGAVALVMNGSSLDW